MADGWWPDSPRSIYSKATQQGTQPVCCGCQ